MRTLLCLLLLAHGAVSEVQIRPDDPRFSYHGRWQISSDLAKTDWPCATLRFTLQASEADSSVTFEWLGLRDRINMTLGTNGTIVHTKLLLGQPV